jgi:hypothetical protein
MATRGVTTYKKYIKFYKKNNFIINHAPEVEEKLNISNIPISPLYLSTPVSSCFVSVVYFLLSTSYYFFPFAQQNEPARPFSKGSEACVI